MHLRCISHRDELLLALVVELARQRVLPREQLEDAHALVRGGVGVGAGVRVGVGVGVGVGVRVRVRVRVSPE
jgi:hypothetical protein